MELLASGSILFEALRAQELLAEQFGLSSRVWSATSWTLLARDAMEAQRWSRLHPNEKPKTAYLRETLGEPSGPVVAVSDWVRAVPGQILPWLPQDTEILGTDGFGRSDTRKDLRCFFEVSGEHITLAALSQMVRRDGLDVKTFNKARKELDIDPEATAPWTL